MSYVVKDSVLCSQVGAPKIGGTRQDGASRAGVSGVCPRTKHLSEYLILLTWKKIATVAVRSQYKVHT